MSAAGLAFALGLGLALWLARSRRERLAFAALAGAPLLAALGYALGGMLPHGAAADAAPAPAPTATTAPAAATGAADALRSEAEELRRAKRFAEAQAAYGRLVAIVPGDVDAWADYADAQAAAAGNDLAAGAQSIDRALAIDPNHLKALWLKASLELQQKRFQDATKLWERLLAQLSPDSNDARIVRANLEETRALASQQGAGR